jgi:hypothetical protein
MFGDFCRDQNNIFDPAKLQTYKETREIENKKA